MDRGVTEFRPDGSETLFFRLILSYYLNLKFEMLYGFQFKKNNSQGQAATLWLPGQV